MKISSEYDANPEHERKCLEIHDYFDGLCVMEKLSGENSVWINTIMEIPLLYDIVFPCNKSYFILRNYSVIKDQYTPGFSCIFLFNANWNERIGMFQGNYSFSRLGSEIRCEYERFYRREIDCDYLKFKKIEISQSICTMSDDVRLEYDVEDVNLDKIFKLKEVMGDLGA